MDFWEILGRQFEENGFFPLEGEGFRYGRVENPILYLVCLLDAEDPERTRKEAHFTALAEATLERLAQMRCTRLVALSVVVDNRGNVPVEYEDNRKEDAFPGGAGERFFRIRWRFSAETGVLAETGQPDCLLGIEKLLAAAAHGEMPEELPLEQGAEGRPVVTAGIFLACAAALCWMYASGQRYAVISAFGLSREGIRAGQYYRFLTSLFLHSGLPHLLSNGVYLYYFGARAERFLGRGRFLLLYLVSGLCGGLCSVLCSGRLAIGASGAIYGLLGAMLLLTRKWGARATGMSYSTMLLLALSAIGFGFLDGNVDNFAHIGGLLGGIAVFCLLLRRKKERN